MRRRMSGCGAQRQHGASVASVSPFTLCQDIPVRMDWGAATNGRMQLLQRLLDVSGREAADAFRGCAHVLMTAVAVRGLRLQQSITYVALVRHDS